MPASYHLLNVLESLGEETADFLIAGDGVYGSVRCFGMSIPVPLVLCEIRGLLPLSSLLFFENSAPDASYDAPKNVPAPFGPSYHMLTHPGELPTLNPARMYQYVFAREGVFLLAGRSGLEVLMPISLPCTLPGLASAQPSVTWNYPRIGEEVVLDMFERARSARDHGNGHMLEWLFYLTLVDGEWHINEPEQDPTGGSVRATASSEEDEMAIIEGHSHHDMRAYFSPTDNRDELIHGGNKVYLVIGGVHSKPHIRTRICVHGYAWDVPANTFFVLPTGIVDCGANR